MIIRDRKARQGVEKFTEVWIIDPYRTKSVSNLVPRSYLCELAMEDLGTKLERFCSRDRLPTGSFYIKKSLTPAVII